MLYNRDVCEHLPWMVREADKLGQVITDFVLDHETYYKAWAQRWFENQQFVYGNQNLKWSKRYDFAVDADFLRQQPSMSRKSQTNISRVVAEALGSMIYAGLPSWDAETQNDSTTQGKRFKSICNKLLDAYMHRLNMDQELIAASYIYPTYGQFAFCVDWNVAGGRVRQYPKFVKQRVPIYTTTLQENGPFGQMEVPVQALNSQGEPMFDEQWIPAVDEMGKPIFENKWSGDARVSVLTPFEYRREPGSIGMHKSKWVQRIRLMDFDEFYSEYKDIAGRTAGFHAVKPGVMNDSLYRFAFKQFMRMAYLTPQMLSDFAQRSENPIHNNLLKHKVVVVEHYDRPNPEKWAQGRRVIVANGICTHVTTPQYHTNKLDGWHPFVECAWLSIAPSSMASAPLNDVVQKNKELNAKDSLIYTATLRNMGSQLLVKNSSGLDPLKLTGIPGGIHEVTDPQTAARWLHDEQPIPPVINQLRQQDKDDVYEVSGAGDALRGERSKGVSTGYALRQLQEREERRLTPARKQFEQAVAGMGEKLIACIQQNAMELEDDVVGFLKRSAAGEFTVQDIISFLNSPIDFGVDVKVTPGSMAYKSKATEQATIMDLLKGPMGHLMQNPKIVDKLLKFFEVESLRDPAMVHSDRAQRENEVFQDMLKFGPGAKGINIPIVMFEDDDQAHLADHAVWSIENAEALQSNPTLLQMFNLHQESHRNQYLEKNGKVPVGTTINTAQQMSNVGSQPAKPIQAIYEQQAQKMSQPPPPPPQGGPPPAPAGRSPTQPNAPGAPGPRPQDPNAPAARTRPAPPTQGGVSV